MTVPLARAIGAGGRLVVVAGNPAIGDVFRAQPEVDEVVVVPKVVAGLRAWAATARRVRPNQCVIPFPSNRWQYTLLAATSRAERVVMHEYPVGRWSTGRRLLRHSKLVQAERGLHDVDQNLRLLQHGQHALEIERSPILPIRTKKQHDDPSRHATNDDFESPLAQSVGVTSNDSAEDGTNAIRETASLSGRDTRSPSIATQVLLQPGCGNTVVGRSKRLPVATWAAVADTLVERGLRVTAVEGPDEAGAGQAIADAASREVDVLPLRGSLLESAATVASAACFVGVDSGLGHVAAAAGVPVVSVFTAADPDRVCPFAYRTLVVTPPDVDGIAWQPRLLYPMDAAGPKLRPTSIDWAAAVRSDDIVAATVRALARR